jgi:hypothetical protein
MKCKQQSLLWHKNSQHVNLPSLTESTNATTIYIRLRTVETPSQSLRADKWGIDMPNKAHTNPEIAMKYGSFMTWSSLKRT